MSFEYAKAKPIRLRDAGKDERWLQELIAKDPAVLGFGDVILIQRERPQPTGGRIDLVLADADTEEKLRYEVEIMLGTVDESHIIRTIEYWDVERRRYPAYSHRAVIVAEEITNRFFNVIGLLNRAIPIVAVQLNAFLLDDKLCLNFVRVLDVVEVEDEEEAGGEQVDREFWVKNNRAKSLAIIDAALALFTDKKTLRVKYNRGHVALGSTSINFMWFMPRKGNYVLIHVDVGEAERKVFLDQLKTAGVEGDLSSRHPVTLHIRPTLEDIQKNPDLFRTIFVRAESWSRE